MRLTKIADERIGKSLSELVRGKVQRGIDLNYTKCIIVNTMNPQLSDKELAALRHIRNWLVHKGRPPSIRELTGALDYKSPRSAALIINRLIKLKMVRRRDGGPLQILNSAGSEFRDAQTVDVPLLGTISCGKPILAEENIEAMVRVSTRLARPPHRYFILRAKGDSMDREGIKDGSAVLVRQQSVATEGDRVVALIDNEATIKEYCRANRMVALMPRSTNPTHKPIILTDDFKVQGVVVAVIPKLE